MVNLGKYLIAAVICLVIGVVGWIMGNILTGVLLFCLLFGGYILWNVLKGIEKNPIPEKEDQAPKKERRVSVKE